MKYHGTNVERIVHQIKIFFFLMYLIDTKNIKC